MKQFVPDDSSIPEPDATTTGQKFLAAVQNRALAVYPDHLESRNKYIFEKLAAEIDRLSALAQSRNAGSMRERTETAHHPLTGGN